MIFFLVEMAVEIFFFQILKTAIVTADKQPVMVNPSLTEKRGELHEGRKEG
jgi:hypothetical protein